MTLQVNAYVAPSDEALAAVQSWLSSKNVTAVSSSAAGDWLNANVTVAQANDLLGASYETFLHVNSGKSYARTLSYSLPDEVAAHIEDVHPSTTFNNPVSTRPVLSVPQSGAKSANVSSDATAQSCATTVTPGQWLSAPLLFIH